MKLYVNYTAALPAPYRGDDPRLQAEADFGTPKPIARFGAIPETKIREYMAARGYEPESYYLQASSLSVEVIGVEDVDEQIAIQRKKNEIKTLKEEVSKEILFRG